MTKTCWIFLIILLLSVKESFEGIPTKPISKKDVSSPYVLRETPWADSVFNSLTLNERIAQLFMVAVYSKPGPRNVDEVTRLIDKYNIGGVIFFQGGPVNQANVTNLYQKIAKTPLAIGIDGEWGLGMRLDSTIKYPHQMMLGATQNEDLVFEMGEDIAHQMKRLGIHINFAPVVDINSNASNPVISNRSFGENREMVTSYALNYMIGLQNNHILAVAKHFPGHGDTESDSHFSLPVINQSYSRIDSFELYPFKQLISCNLGGVLIAHISIPVLDSDSKMPSTLSKKIVTSLLRDSLQFNGLVFSDALNMKGVSNLFPSGELEVRSIEAGIDILVMPENVPLAISKIKEAIASGRISEEQINRSCKKLLVMKEWAGLDKPSIIEIKNLVKDLNAPKSEVLNRRIVENAITVVKNNNELIPLKNLSVWRTAVVSIGEEAENEFSNTINLYNTADHFSLNKKADTATINQLLRDLKQYNLTIVAVMGTNYSPLRNYGISSSTIDFLNRVALNNRVILNVFTPPYFLSKITSLNFYKTVIISYEDIPLAREYSAQLIFGGIGASGSLPVTATKEYNYNKGIITTGNIRFKYTIPEDINISSGKLSGIDSIVNDAIKKNVFPGCQILAAKDGIVFFHKAYGYHTYDSSRAVLPGDLYDLASVTKITATLPAVMKLYESGSLKLKRKLADYLPELKKTNKHDINLMEMLTHQAGLTPFIPFYMGLIQPANNDEKLTSNSYSANFTIKLGRNYYLNKNNSFKNGYFTKIPSYYFGNQVADSLFVLTTFEDSIFRKMAESNILPKKEYKYSDLGFMYLYKIIQNQSGIPLQEYVRRNFYSRLGATSTGYWPLLKYDKSQIAPTENDLVFRHQLLQGYVHDPAAALMGGVSGHAGLFSNANDIAKVMQMYLNGGTYGGERYFEQATIDYFNSTPFMSTGNRRGIGFDKPEMNPQKPGPTCYCVSAKSFGHSGFTGTFTWADPENGLLYVFLSNRVCPNAENTKITEMNIRSKIQEVLVKSLAQ